MRNNETFLRKNNKIIYTITAKLINIKILFPMNTIIHKLLNFSIARNYSFCPPARVFQNLKNFIITNIKNNNRSKFLIKLCKRYSRYYVNFCE